MAALGMLSRGLGELSLAEWTDSVERWLTY